MQPQTRKLTIIIVATLLVLMFVWIISGPGGSLRPHDNQIVLKDPGSVDRIDVADLFDTVTLIKMDQEWLLNGVEEVNEVAVENLLFAAERLQIRSIVTGDTIPEPGLTKRIQFSKGDRTLLTYDLYNQGDHYLVSPAGSDRAFIVSMAGYPDLKLEGVFSSSANHYREHMLLDLSPSEIVRIKIELAGGEAFQFTQDADGVIQCSPANDLTELPDSLPDDLSMRLLFSYFTSIRFENLAGISAAELESGEGRGNRLARLYVESDQGEQHTLSIYPYYEQEGAGPHMFKALVVHNNDPEALLVNYIYLDVLMRDLSHYFGP